jgi:hypothetical protein
MRTDRQKERQTDMTELMFAFRSFANAPKTEGAETKKKELGKG